MVAQLSDLVIVPAKCSLLDIEPAIALTKTLAKVRHALPPAAHTGSSRKSQFCQYH